MSFTETPPTNARCTNLPECAKAARGETLEWYRGAGEYCPECGEALTRVPLAASPPSAVPLPEAAAVSVAESTARQTEPPTAVRAPHEAPKTTADSPLSAAAIGRRAPVVGRKAWMTPLRWLWVVAAAFIAGAAILYVERRALATDRTANDAVTVCPVPSAQQLISDIVRGYTAKSGIPANRFVVSSAGVCDVRFATAAAASDDVIARDGIVAIVNPLNALARISESQLRSIFNGSLRDWSQLGEPHGRIVPILPDAATDEAKALAATLFYGVTVDGSVRRAGTSADVTRAVSGADRTSRGAIGLVAFSQAVPAKVVPLAYLPAPSVLSIATHRYPFTMTIAVESGSAPVKSAAAGFLDYARSSDGAAIVAKAGLVGREGL